MKTLGEQIRQVRLQYGMSQRELARRSHITPQAMNDLEQGRTKDPGFRLVYRIAHTLGISLDTFVLPHPPP